MRREVEIMLSNDKTLEDFLDPNRDPKERYKQVRNLLDLTNFDEEDWTFKQADTKEFTHTIFSQYPARMIPQIARKLIKNYYPDYDDETKKKPILDPFAGSGTTGTEAILRNISAITFDLNPLAHLIQKVKTTVIDPKKIREKFRTILSLINLNKGRRFEQYIPKNINLDFWYKKEVVDALSLIRFSIETTFGEEKLSKCNQNLKDFFLICFGMTTRVTSYQRLGEHKTYRIPKEKFDKFDREVNPLRTFTEVHEKYLKGKLFLYNYYKTHKFKAICKPVLGDSMILKGVKDNSVDLIVTSPPYGDSHTTVAYGQFSRFPSEWIYLDSESISQIDANLLGGRKQEEAIEKSNLLLETLKKILLCEVNQQNEAIFKILEGNQSMIIDNLKLKSLTLQSVNTFREEMKLLEVIKNSINKQSSLANLLKLKNEYFIHIKKLRTIWNLIINEISTEINEKKLEKMKVYDDRIGYVISFFNDFYNVFRRLFDVLDLNRKCCFVIGNRTVKGVSIPNDDILIEMGKTIGFEHVNTFYRDIPGKRIPKKTAPSNREGEVESTIERESIIILNKGT